jgi:leucyl aminopeptidase
MFESISVERSFGKTAGVPAIVVGVFKDKKLDTGTEALDRRLGGAISAALARPECTGDAGRLAEAFAPTAKGAGGAAGARVIVAGLGKREGFKAASLRTVAGAVGRRLAHVQESAASVELAGALEQARADVAFAGRAFGEGLGIVGWNYDRFKGTGSGETPKRPRLRVASSDAAFAKGMDLGLRLAASTNFARDLSQTPPNVATPAYMARQAREMARRSGLGFKVFEGPVLERERFVGLINVGKASENKPCMVRLEYTPSRVKKNAKPVVLVGKTMTYDSGGLSLKINNGMVGMKRDKDGGCAVLGAMHAVANYIKPSRPVVALLAVAENSISDEAYRPDDVLTYRNGVTVEVTNTDAEGRLVLADALCWACEKENPHSIIDLATLTGGVVTALGSTFAGLWCDDDGLRGRLERAMETSGERWWRLPHDPEYRDMMKSPIADILNSNPNRKAHPIQGAAFLSYFVKAGIPWAHIDIAGVHAVEGDTGPFCKGPTGWGVRLLADLLADA